MKTHGFSILALAGAALGGSLLSFVLFDGHGSATATKAPAAARPSAPAACAYNFARVSGFQRTKPLIYSEPACESPRLEDLRTAIGSLVDGFKATGQLTSASVYLRDFRQAEWTMYNGSESYDPGSMLKVPLLLTYLSMSEEDPSLLKRTWTCEKGDFNIPQFTAFPSAQAQLNVSYTVAQLLDLAITSSDNRATVMLLRHVPQGRYLKTFTDLGLPVPDWNAKTYRMNVRDYSVFMKALYNSALLGPMNSERALELMARSDFNRGLVAGLPPGVEVAHKFGEAGDPMEKQLHETGLVYADGNPYLITVMTRGSNVDSLASAIASVSRLVYDRMHTP